MIHRIFLTGDTGFLGSHFLSQALQAGHEVIALRGPANRPKVILPVEPEWLKTPSPCFKQFASRKTFDHLNAICIGAKLQMYGEAPP